MPCVIMCGSRRSFGKRSPCRGCVHRGRALSPAVERLPLFHITSEVSLLPRFHPRCFHCTGLICFCQAMLIVEAHVVIGGTVFLQAHGSLVCTCFCRVVGQVSSVGGCLVVLDVQTFVASVS